MIICGAVNTHLTHPSVENGTPFKEWGALDGHPLRICNPCSEWALCTRREQFYGMKSTLYVAKISMHVCVCVCSHTRLRVCLRTFTRATLKHTHSKLTCVCFTFSILGCYCFVAVLGAAAQRVEAEEEEEGEVLDRHRCLLALAALRHAKWFQVGTHSLPVFVPDAYCSLTTHPERIVR